MFNFDIKSIILWGVVGLFISNGVYRTYIKLFGETAQVQAKAYGSVNQCFFLQDSYDIDEIKVFLNEYHQNAKKIIKSDLVMTGVNKALEVDKQSNVSGMGVPLRTCIKKLKKHLKQLES
jgi:hypothetical protein